jgi:hypothetical protein
MKITTMKRIIVPVMAAKTSDSLLFLLTTNYAPDAQSLMERRKLRENSYDFTTVFIS